MKDKKIEESTEALRTLKTASCPSLSGKSQLTYMISCGADKAVYISITGNSGGGLYSKKPVPISEMIPLLNSAQITSGTLQPVFKGTSANTSGFILAAIQNEGIIKLISETSGKYQRDDLNGFIANIQVLVDTEPSKPSKVKDKKIAEPNTDIKEGQA